MNIASPRLVHLHAPLGWRPRHLGGMTGGLQQDGAHGAAHRSSDRSPASSWPSRQIGGPVRGYPAGSSVCWPARRVQSSIIAQADTLYSYALPTHRERAHQPCRHGRRTIMRRLKRSSICYSTWTDHPIWISTISLGSVSDLMRAIKVWTAPTTASGQARCCLRGRKMEAGAAG